MGAGQVVLPKTTKIFLGLLFPFYSGFLLVFVLCDPILALGIVDPFAVKILVHFRDLFVHIGQGILVEMQLTDELVLLIILRHPPSMDLEKLLGTIDRLLDVAPDEIFQRLRGNADTRDPNTTVHVLLSPVIFRSFRRNISDEAAASVHFNELAAQHVFLLTAALRRLCACPLELLLCHEIEHIINDRWDPNNDPFLLRPLCMSPWFLGDKVVAIRDLDAPVFLRSEHGADGVFLPSRAMCAGIPLTLWNAQPI